jgi:hypothetical protein
MIFAANRWCQDYLVLQQWNVCGTPFTEGGLLGCAGVSLGVAFSRFLRNVGIYLPATRYYIPEDSNLHSYRRDDVTSYTNYSFILSVFMFIGNLNVVKKK